MSKQATHCAITHQK